MDLDNLKLFAITVEEYKRFASQLDNYDAKDNYNEFSYIKVNTKLMLLRKYGNKNENIFIEKILQQMLNKYSSNREQLEQLLDDYHKIESQQLTYILADGTKLDIYHTIEDVMYGMYLHADKNRIERLKSTEESLRFICVRKYVEDLENVVLKTFDLLKTLDDSLSLKNDNHSKATTIYLGDTSKNMQNIKKSLYWANLYGKDGTDLDLDNIVQDLTNEDVEILSKCLAFLDELEKDEISTKTMDSLIFPTTKKDWKDYSEAKSFYSKIEKPGLSSKVRYNKDKNMAYVRIFPQVDDFFIIDTPHIITNICEICLVKVNNKLGWKIFSMGSHLDSFIK